MEHDSCLICIPITTARASSRGGFHSPNLMANRQQNDSPNRRRRTTSFRTESPVFVTNDRRNVSSLERPDHGPPPIEASKKVGLNV